MAELPAMLKVQGRRAVVVGGGSVALRRARSLADAGAEVGVVAPEAEEGLLAVATRAERRPYRDGDLAGAFLAVAATDRPEVNEAVAREAGARGVLVNRADMPEAGDLVIPAHTRDGPITVAVHSGGGGPRAAATLRDEMLERMDRGWIPLIETVRPYRERVKRRVTDPGARRHLLKRLGGDEAWQVLKRDGVAGLQRYCQQLVEAAERG